MICWRREHEARSSSLAAGVGSNRDATRAVHAARSEATDVSLACEATSNREHGRGARVRARIGRGYRPALELGGADACDRSCARDRRPSRAASRCGDFAVRISDRRRNARRRSMASSGARMILGTSRAVRVFAYPEPVDLRKGYDGLYGLVKTGLGRDPLSGDLFLFVNKRRKACKVLVWDGTGLCIFQKRLERGTFASLWRSDGASVHLTSTELALFIEGCDLVGRRALSPGIVKPNILALDRSA